MTAAGAPLLELGGVNAFYGRAHVLFGISLVLRRGEIVVLLGRNGAGKSTTFKSVAGLVSATGTIRLNGRDIGRLAPHRIARLGVGYVPEDRQIFPNLTVAENLEIAAKPGADGSVHWTLPRLEAVFPLLGALMRRAGGSLSGGEQQLVTIARTLMGNPDVLLLDEPSEGLAQQRAVGCWRVGLCCFEGANKGVHDERRVVAEIAALTSPQFSDPTTSATAMNS